MEGVCSGQDLSSAGMLSGKEGRWETGLEQCIHTASHPQPGNGKVVMMWAYVDSTIYYALSHACRGRGFVHVDI